MVGTSSSLFSRTLSKIRWTCWTTPAEAAPYTIIATTAIAMRQRYGQMNSKRREKTVTAKCKVQNSKCKPRDDRLLPCLHFAFRILHYTDRSRPPVTISVRVRLVPAPGVGHNRIQIGPLRHPPQVRADLLRRGIEDRGVSGTARCGPPGHLFTGRLFYGCNHLSNRGWALCPDVIGA